MRMWSMVWRHQWGWRIMSVSSSQGRMAGWVRGWVSETDLEVALVVVITMCVIRLDRLVAELRKKQLEVKRSRNWSPGFRYPLTLHMALCFVLFGLSFQQVGYPLKEGTIVLSLLPSECSAQNLTHIYYMGHVVRNKSFLLKTLQLIIESRAAPTLAHHHFDPSWDPFC